MASIRYPKAPSINVSITHSLLYIQATDSVSLGTIGPEIITIKVGEKEVVFTVHKDFLMYASGWFVNTLTKGFAERDEGVLYYHCRLGDMVGVGSKMDEKLAKLTDLYALADYFDVPYLANAVVDTIYLHYKIFDTCVPTREMVVHAYNRSPENCLFIRFYADTKRMTDEFVEDDESSRDPLPTHFWARYALGLVHGRDRVGLPRSYHKRKKNYEEYLEN
ncbi:hypothetical protein M501DRAFT_1056090 [Patellaria atrata CBS 101060]|uniref:BTB domain-containing protein n=1 Tax=Patellaria atrata CBS 101060 TaxID=1346257 RepID=A0A9P4VRB5_9PEZI|nr:hypothetical protein M501DRAFT_1056090 [Patellaria atrata CBS 101060]